tara:strand:+ start:5750 stop:7180 length:1431 start_codon:yes stop_codon:yes gene_type:complete
MAIESIKLNRKSFIRNSVSIQGIKNSIGDLSSALQKSNTFARNLAKESYETAKFKSTLISQDQKYFRRRQENFRRKQREDLIEASTVGGTVKKTGSIINNSSRGFLGRILDALGIILVGWSVTNFDKIIKHGEVFIRTIIRTIGAIDRLLDGILDVVEDFTMMLTNTNNTLSTQAQTLEEEKQEMRNAVNFVDKEFLEAEKTIVSDVLDYDDPDKMGFGDIKPEFLNDNYKPNNSSDDNKDIKGGTDKDVNIDNFFGDHIDSSEYTKRDDGVEIDSSNVSDGATTLTIQYDDGVSAVFTRLGGGNFNLDITYPDGEEEQKTIKVPSFNKGGLVTGYGNEDTIPALLTPGEFVITAETVDKLGSEFFAALNSISESNIIPEMTKKLSVSDNGEVMYKFVEVVNETVTQMQFEIPKMKEEMSENLNSSGNIEKTIMVPIPKINSDTGSVTIGTKEIDLPPPMKVNIMKVLSDLELSYT